MTAAAKNKEDEARTEGRKVLWTRLGFILSTHGRVFNQGVTEPSMSAGLMFSGGFESLNFSGKAKGQTVFLSLNMFQDIFLNIGKRDFRTPTHTKITPWISSCLFLITFQILCKIDTWHSLRWNPFPKAPGNRGTPKKLLKPKHYFSAPSDLWVTFPNLLWFENLLQKSTLDWI